MNEWKEADWFKTWLVLARQGQNAMKRAEAASADWSPNDRQTSRVTTGIEAAPVSELEVTE
jgi:hypothetical protein